MITPSPNRKALRAGSPSGALLRRHIHRGVVEASALLVDEEIVGVLEARRRVMREWRPGTSVHRVGTALLVRFVAARWIDCAASPGLPLVRIAAVLASAPLAADELEAIAPPVGAVVIVRGGAPSCVVPAEDAVEDPASYLDVSSFDVVSVTALGPAPAPPTIVAAPTKAPPRSVFGVAAAPAQLADVAAALRAARSGVVRNAGGQRGPTRLARFVRAMATWMAAVFSPRTTSRALPSASHADAPKTRALVVVPQRTRSGPSFLERARSALKHVMASLAVRANLAPFLGRRQAEYLGKMLDMFERGDLEEALRHAIPLGGEESAEGRSEPALSVPTSRTALLVTSGGGTSSSIFAPDAFYDDLRRRYRAAFERLEREGRIEEAAFVLAELLRESAEAVAFLERHRKFHLAAEIAEARALAPGLVVRQWMLAGEAARAVKIARRHGVFADAIARLDKDPQGRVLRVLWAETLAEAGDFAAAVDTIWPVEEARRVAGAWIDAALAQGGGAAARMLAKKLELFPEAFAEVRDRALVLLDDTEGSSLERRAFAEALCGVPTAAARTLARPVIRALVRDGARSGEAPTRSLVERLTTFAADEPLRVDLPAWPSIAQIAKGDGAVTHRVALAERPEPRSVTIAPSDGGACAVYDAVHLSNGRTVLALGESGVRVLARDGRTLFHLAEPAHQLVISDHGDRALALARRGTVWRIARIDLVRRRAEVWCEAAIDCASLDFDGSQWVVAAHGKLLVIDALESRFEALAWFPLGDGIAATAIARSPGACVVATYAAAPGYLRYDLPSWTLRARGLVDGWTPSHGECGMGAGASGQVVSLTRREGELVTMVNGDGGRVVSRGAMKAEGEATPHAAAIGASWLAYALRTKAGVDVILLDVREARPRARFALGGSTAASLRLSASSLTVADDRGRMLVVDLEYGSMIRDLRLAI